jgi:hypothetical protein
MGEFLAYDALSTLRRSDGTLGSGVFHLSEPDNYYLETISNVGLVWLPIWNS